MPVEMLAGMVAPHGGSWVAVAGGDLHVAQVDTGVDGEEGVPEHVRMHAWQLHTSLLGKAP
jgi:hypothetical protein